MQILFTEMHFSGLSTLPHYAGVSKKTLFSCSPTKHSKSPTSQQKSYFYSSKISDINKLQFNECTFIVVYIKMVIFRVVFFNTKKTHPNFFLALCAIIFNGDFCSPSTHLFNTRDNLYCLCIVVSIKTVIFSMLFLIQKKTNFFSRFAQSSFLMVISVPPPGDTFKKKRNRLNSARFNLY